MHLVEYLKALQRPGEDSPFAKSTISLPQIAVEVEYRLACSGELYNRKVLTADWRKSDATRVLLKEPFELFVASHPFDDYPQELCVRWKLSYVTETHELRRSSSNVPITSTSTFLPDDEIIEDLCSILTLLARRLICVVGKIRERRLPNDASVEPAGPQTAAALALATVPDFLGSYGWDTPASVLKLSRFAVWRRRPITIITSYEGQRAEFHDPPPTGVDTSALREVLLKLPDLPGVEEIIHTGRLYKTALELIESRPDITYQLLISAIETMAGEALHDFEPDESAKLNTKYAVLERARGYGLDEERAKALALEACRGIPWAGQKFKKFILDNVSPEKFDTEDPLFPFWSFLRPVSENFEKASGAIYSARSGNLHRGNPFPPWIGVGTSTTAGPNDVPITGLGPNDVPPVTWFERVVSMAVRRYVIGQCAVHAEPFSDLATPDSTGPE
jgi:hypothetical protein